jgi:hypothetical protein
MASYQFVTCACGGEFSCRLQAVGASAFATNKTLPQVIIVLYKTEFLFIQVKSQADIEPDRGLGFSPHPHQKYICKKYSSTCIHFIKNG